MFADVNVSRNSRVFRTSSLTAFAERALQQIYHLETKTKIEEDETGAAARTPARNSQNNRLRLS